MLTDADEAARRVRAARGYARLTREQLARQTSLSMHQLKLLEDGQRKVTTQNELLEIGRACEVPDEFMEVGFLGAQGVYRKIARIFAVVLSQDMPTILAEAERLGVDVLPALTHDLMHDGPGDADGPPGSPAAAARRRAVAQAANRAARSTER